MNYTSEWNGSGKRMAVAMALAIGAFVLPICGNSGSASAATTTSTASRPPDTASIVAGAKFDSNAHKLLPAAIKSSKTLVVGMDATKGKPWAYLGTNGQIEGLVREVADSLGTILGVKIETKNTPFLNLIPGLQAGRFQLTIAPMLQSSKRLKVLDMVGWIHGGSSFMVRSTSDHNDLAMSNVICGMVLGGVTGTSEAALMTAQGKKCKEQGKAPIQLHLFPKSTDNILALKAGRVEAISTSTAQIGYIASIDPSLKRSGGSFNSGLSSMAMIKGSPLAPAIVAAFQSFIDSGVYDKLLSAYGMDSLAMKHSVLDQEAKK